MTTIINKKPSANGLSDNPIYNNERVLDLFMTYVRTKQLKSSSYRDSVDDAPIHISTKEIEKRFFPYDKKPNRRIALEILEKSGRLKIVKEITSKGRTCFKYASLEKGNIDLSLIPIKEDNFDNAVIRRMRDYLMDVSLKPNSPSTNYFNFFLRFKDERPDLFFTVDKFARRIHTPVTNFHKAYRNNILLSGRETTSLDVVTMQPLLLGKVLKNEIGSNEYSNWLDSGVDIYEMLQAKAALSTRDEAKQRFFQIIFAPASNKLVEMFGKSNWIDWVNQYKQLVLPKNPHNAEKPYSNLAWLLQTTEVKVMYKVWKALYSNSIPFLVVHDEIIIEMRYLKIAKSLFEEVMSHEFEYFKLN